MNPRMRQKAVYVRVDGTKGKGTDRNQTAAIPMALAGWDGWRSAAGRDLARSIYLIELFFSFVY
jgi:hypothetical protein